MRFSAKALMSNVVHLYECGLPPGESTGYFSLDNHFTIAPGQFTTITGIPGHGKSEFLDQMMVNLAKRAGWKFAVFSPENHPLELHISKLLEKYVGKPFGDGPTPRMSKDEMATGVAWVDKHFTFLKFDEPNLKAILHHASDYIGGFPEQSGIVIDPWNQIEHLRPANMTEAEYLSHCLSAVLYVARENRVHFFVVCHPKIMLRDKEGNRPVPTPYDINGGAMWFNKSDNIICVHRDVGTQAQTVDIHIQKIKFKHIGKPGKVSFRYDRPTGRYFEMPHVLEARQNDYKVRSSGE